MYSGRLKYNVLRKFLECLLLNLTYNVVSEYLEICNKYRITVQYMCLESPYLYPHCFFFLV
jgi:hypothetical protein